MAALATNLLTVRSHSLGCNSGPLLLDALVERHLTHHSVQLGFGLLAELVVGGLKHLLRVVPSSSLVSVEVEEVPVVCVCAGLHAVLGDVVLVHIMASLSHVQELLDGGDFDAAIGVVAEPEHLEKALVLARHVISNLKKGEVLEEGAPVGGIPAVLGVLPVLLAEGP